MHLYQKIFSALILTFIISACTKPIDFGKELLSDDVVDVQFDESFEVSAYTRKEEPLNYFSFSNNRNASRIFVGNFENDVFGRVSAESYFKLAPPRSVDLSNATIDSINLILEFDRVNFYGDTTLQHQLGVYLLNETMHLDSTYTTSSTVEYDAEPIGMTEPLLMKPRTSLISNITEEDTSYVSPRIVIPLNQKFIDLYKSIPLEAYVDNNLFYEQIPGFLVKNEIESAAIMAYSLINSNTKIEVYYTNEGDEEPNVSTLNFLSGQPAFSKYDHTFEGTTVEPYIENVELSDRLFLLGGEGLYVELNFPNLDEIRNKSISYAVLEFVVDELEEVDSEKFTRIPFVLASRYNTEGKKIVLAEATYAITSQNLSLFGGREVEVLRGDETVKAYRFNITNHFQSVLKGDNDERLILSAFSAAEQFSHLVFKGNNSDLEKPLLRLVYTD